LYIVLNIIARFNVKLNGILRGHTLKVLLIFKQYNTLLQEFIACNTSLFYFKLVESVQISQTKTQDIKTVSLLKMEEAGKLNTFDLCTESNLNCNLKVNNINLENFAYYLAGLIEGDGNIYVPINKRYPSLITISFNSKDYPLIAVIQKLLGIGSIYKIKGKNSYSYTVGNLKGLIKIANIINGKMRTPKIVQLYTLIDYLNGKLNNLPSNKIIDNSYYSIKKLPLDSSHLSSNA